MLSIIEIIMKLFYNCYKLDTIYSSSDSNNKVGKVTIGSEVTSIGAYAFAYCSSLTTVSFPSANYIGAYAFYSCYNLTSIYFTYYSVPYLEDPNAFYDIAPSYRIYVAESLYSPYIVASKWNMISSHITSYIS